MIVSRRYDTIPAMGSIRMVFLLPQASGLPAKPKCVGTASGSACQYMTDMAIKSISPKAAIDSKNLSVWDRERSSIGRSSLGGMLILHGDTDYSYSTPAGVFLLRLLLLTDRFAMP